jgi:two-component system KDP operon response regulator KdpE
MADVIVAVLSDGDIIDKIVAVAERLGRSVVLSPVPGDWVGETPQIEEAGLLVVDLDAPGVAGPESCRRIRGFSNVPILVLGSRVETAWTVSLLKAGADCYLPKPVEAELLEAHMEVLLRRSPPLPGKQPAITIRQLTVDLARKEVRLQGEPVALTPGEYRLLTCLATHLGKVVSNSDLLRAMSGYECPEQEAREIVKVHVSRLRGKIDRNPNEPSYLLNVRGFGYMLERRSRAQSPQP